MGEERTGRVEGARARWASRAIEVNDLLLMMYVICGIWL